MHQAYVHVEPILVLLKGICYTVAKSQYSETSVAHSSTVVYSTDGVEPLSSLASEGSARQDSDCDGCVCGAVDTAHMQGSMWEMSKR